MLTLIVGCADAGDAGRIDVSFAPGALSGPMADPGTPVVDGSGYAHLDLFPLFLVVEIRAADLDTPVLGSWPDEVPDPTPDEVELDLVVPAGSGRRIEVALLVADEGGSVTTSVSPAPGEAPTTADVVSGETSVVDVALTELPRGLVRATWASGVEVASVAWVDASARVVLPPAEAAGGAVETALTVGREYWPRVVRGDGEIIDIADHVIDLTAEDELLETSLDIPE
jgi:hypothetical protein